jgi:hypothetical protein
MPVNVLRVLCVHGINTDETDSSWQRAWDASIRAGIQTWNPSRPVEVRFLHYNDVFAQHRLSAVDYAQAFAKLTASGLYYGVADLFRRGRAVRDFSSALRWTAGMVVQWAENSRLREQARQRLVAALADPAYPPDLICAHSLGSLVTYDTLRRDPALAGGRTLITFGSQVGHPFVRGTLGGRIEELGTRFWYHLFNREDAAFTHRLSLPSPRFAQIETTFDIDGPLDHAAENYLSHPATANRAWHDLAGGARSFSQSVRTYERLAKRPKRRALLVGINEYPDPKDRLQGCVNDVFLMSSALQESGFPPEEIRVVLDDRATARNVYDRLEWLLDGVGRKDERVFYYSGHGAQIPDYGPSQEVDHVDECLCTHDFDWTPEHAVTDDRFFDLYAQLPYDAWFVAIMDCCHSGGMTRDGAPRIRGLNPPDDVRHRALRWDADEEMWTERESSTSGGRRLEPRLRRSLGAPSTGDRRLGRAMPLRRLSGRASANARAAMGHKGPYLPILLEACQETELSFEYLHGSTSYGAFTYSLVKNLRRAAKRGVTFERLLTQTQATLKRLGYDQHPALIGPRKWVTQRVPWGAKRGV